MLEYVSRKLAKEAKLRMFEQLHQDDETQIRRADAVWTLLVAL